MRCSGLSFEAHCIENLIQAVGSHRLPYFYRTQVGSEIDLVLEKGGKPEMTIEVKRPSTQTASPPPQSNGQR